MKTLYLLRHAKSSWDDVSLADFDRPLNARGARTAPIMGGVMKREEMLPDIILSSPAIRAKQTAIAVSEAGELNAELILDDSIYEASPQALRQIVGEMDDRYESVMLVGHNPGMESFIRYLTGQVEAMPTAALAVVDLDIVGWADISEDCGTLRRVFRPKDLDN